MIIISKKAAAINFPYLNKNIATVLTGVSSTEEVYENINNYNTKINMIYGKNY